MDRREPIFNVPGVVLAILALCVGVHVAGNFMDPETATWFLLMLAFIPARYSGLAADLPGGEIAAFTSPLTHMVTHADSAHLAINAAWLLAFGSILARRVGATRFLAFSIVGGLAGALLFLVMHPGLVAPVVGASGAIAAMMGGVMRFLFNAIDVKRGYLLREAPQLIALTPLGGVFRDRRIVIASLVFLGLNLFALFGFGAFGSAGAIAWEAHVGGYLFGLLCFGAFDTAPQNSSPTPAEVD